MVIKLNEKRLYFEPKAIYKSKLDGQLYIMVDRTGCEMDDGQESCAMCKGRIVFGRPNGDIVIKCPYMFNSNNFQWETYFEKMEIKNG